MSVERIQPAFGDRPFEVGDRVKVVSFGHKGDKVFIVLEVTDTHVRARSDDATLCLRREKFAHA